MDPFLDTHYRDWKLGYSSLTSASTDRRYHTNSDGGVIQVWCLEERLGSGSYGHVWKERGLSGRTLNKVRVVKQLFKNRANFIQSSRRELHALTTFSKLEAPEVE